MSHTVKNTQIIKTAASQLGFSFCGISKAEFLEEEARQLEEWLRRGYHGKMSYMERYFDKRVDPTLLVPGAKSVVSLIFNYYPSTDLAEQGTLKIAKYAYGEDYHFIIRERLKQLLEIIRENIGDVHGRAFVDSAPVMERTWAARAGLGWAGKNTLLLNRDMGSFFFLAELIIDLELEYDSPAKDYCGTCTACMDACPTQAITEPYVVDGSRCISYYTIELREEIPQDAGENFDNWIFGCDICQDVCPWNRFARPHSEPRLDPSEPLQELTRQEWREITRETFETVFGRSPLSRAGYDGLMRNITHARQSHPDQ